MFSHRLQIRRLCRTAFAVLLGSFAAVEPPVACGLRWPRCLLPRRRFDGAAGGRRRAVRRWSKGICRGFVVISSFCWVLFALSPGQLCVWLFLVSGGVCVLYPLFF
jgi:hypothetical protein